MRTHHRRIAILATLPLVGCGKPNHVEHASPLEQPPAKTVEDQPSSMSRKELDQALETLEEAEPKWLRVARLREGVEGGWATGRFIPEDNKLVIDTEGVDEFVIDLDGVDIDWTRRVVLRINGDNSELTRRHYPTLRLNRTEGGRWLPVKPQDPRP